MLQPMLAILTISTPAATAAALITSFILLLVAFFFLTSSVCVAMEEAQAFRHSIYATLCLLGVFAVLIVYGTYRIRKASEQDAERPCLSVPCFDEACIHNPYLNKGGVE